MSSRLRLPTAAVALLSIALSGAVIGCAARTLHVFNDQQQHNPWWLPIWPNHFDTRSLRLLIGTSTATVVLNGVLVAALFIAAMPANFIVLISSLLSSACALIAIVFTAVLNNHAPGRDTLQTWTCRWSETLVHKGENPPDQFNTLCYETRFAFYITIPLFIIQLVLLSLALLVLAGPPSSTGRKDAARLYDEPEKGGHELGAYRSASMDAKSEYSARSANDRVGILRGSERK